MPGAAKTGVTTFTTPSDTQVRFTRVVNASRALTFEVYTRPEHLRRWLLGLEGWTMFICEMEPRAGGSWRYGWRKEDGTEMILGGTVTEFLPPVRIVNTERWGPEWPETINTVEFIEANGQTTIVTTITYPSKEARDAAMQTGMQDGLDVSYAHLDRLLASLV